MQTETHTPASPETLARLPSKICGIIWRNRETGLLWGCLSCDSGCWLELIDALGFPHERHFAGMRNEYDQVGRARMRVTSRVETDHAGDFPVTRTIWRGERHELMLAMAVAERVAA